MATLQLPENVGSREQARDLLSFLPDDLQKQGIALDCGSLLIATPSFFDEIIKQVLVSRAAERLTLINASPRARTLAERSAKNRGVQSRLSL